MGDMDGMIEDTAAGILKGKHLKAKFLSFCENRRPAYRGTWSKISSSVLPRQPFAKHVRSHTQHVCLIYASKFLLHRRKHNRTFLSCREDC